MMNANTPGHTLSALIMLSVLLVVPTTGSLAADLNGQVGGLTVYSQAMPASQGKEALIRTTLSVEAYEIAHTRQGHDVRVEGFGSLLVPGKPKLPSRILSIAIPPGAELVDVEYSLGKGVTLPGSYQVVPSPLPRVIGDENPALYKEEMIRYENNRSAIYGSNNPYPAEVAEFVRTSGYREYNLVDVRVSPLRYYPVSGQLIYFPEITVDVKYRDSSDRSDAVIGHLPRTERVAKRFIVNHDLAQDWYSQDKSGDRGLHDYVIITLDSLVSHVSQLVAWETFKGRTVEVVTTTWIEANYGGGYDLAENIRNFLRDKYPAGEWGIEDVLIVGHYDDVPMRRVAQDMGYGSPETDFYYAELSHPDSTSWDADGDHQYGENSDPTDFYAEVNVGRIPWSSASTVENICQKSIDYEQTADESFKKNILLLGGFFWEDTDNAELMEAKINKPWMSDWTVTRMYEQNSTVYSTFSCDYPLRHGNVMSVWPTGTYAFVNWAGHGSPTSTHIMGYGSEAFIRSSDCSSLNDDYPAIIFADACSNSDTDHVSIGQAMMQQGAVGFVGATKVAYGTHGWNDPGDGSGQSLDYYFTTYVTSCDYTQGQAHQRALQDMYTYGLWYSLKYETFEWGALFGNPNLGMAYQCFEGDCLTPQPDPLSIREDPTFTYASGPTEITLRAEAATDDTPPIEFAFNCVAGYCHNRNWDTSDVHVDTGLNVNSYYTYRVQARDSNTYPNTTSLDDAPTINIATAARQPGEPLLDPGSPPESVITLEFDAIDNPSWTDFAIQCTDSSDAAWDNHFVDAAGLPSVTEIWQRHSNWGTVQIVGLQPGTAYTFAVKAQNLDEIETALGTPATITTAGSACASDMGDLNGDGSTTGEDIQCFLNCLLDVEDDCACPCGDWDNPAGVGMEDIASFVNTLLDLD